VPKNKTYIYFKQSHRQQTMTKLLLSLLFASAMSNVCAQEQLTKTAQPDFLPDSFYNTFQDHLPMLNGRLFTGYPAGIKGNPFHPKNTWSPAVFKYDGIWYKAPAMLDVYNNDLIIQRSDSTFPFILVPERIEQYMIDGRNFVLLDQKTDPMLSRGFYEVLSEGSFAFIAKRRKILEEEVVDRTVEREFVVSDMFYVRKDNKFYRVKKKGDLFALIKDKKSAIQKSIREQQIDIKKNLEQAIIIAAGFYK
jgi:hypothetical protein